MERCPPEGALRGNVCAEQREEKDGRAEELGGERDDHDRSREREEFGAPRRSPVEPAHIGIAKAEPSPQQPEHDARTEKVREPASEDERKHGTFA